MTYSETAMLDRLAVVLLHFLWQGALVGAVLACALAAARAATPRTRYAMACGALLLMFLFPAATYVWVGSGAPPAPGMRFAGRPAAAPEAPTAPAAPGTPAAYLQFVTLAWLAGVCLFSLRLASGWNWMRRTVRCAEPRREWQAAAASIARRLGLTRAVRVLESARVAAPLVFGWVRPAILLPVQAFSGLSRDEVEAVLAHEIAHIMRRDYLVNLLQSVVETLLFYHPAVWWVSRKIREEREHCCDDIALSLRVPRDVYACALLKLEEGRGTALPAPAAGGGDLKRRVARILGTPSGPTPRAWLAPAVVAVLLLSALAAAAARPASVAPPEPPEPAAQAPSAPPPAAQPDPSEPPLPCGEEPYRKWLDEDVFYIIAPRERKAMEQFKDPPECEHFIEQFWKRRDPTPGTEVNEFKEEHYRRIAYANGRFAYGDRPGWQTDRGAIYIMYGPPDEIESHPQAQRESWRYRYIEGIGQDIIVEFRGEEYKIFSAPLKVHQR